MARKAYQNIWKSVTGMPAANLAGKRYLFGKFDANSQLVVAGAGEATVGVIQEPNNVGQPTQVGVHGELFIIFGATVAAGQEVMSDANGKAVPFVPGTATNRAAGFCTVGGAVDEIGTILRH